MDHFSNNAITSEARHDAAESACLESQLAVSGVAVAGSHKRPSRLLGLALELKLHSSSSKKLGRLFKRRVSLD